MNEELTLVLVKPDGVKRRLAGEIIKRLEQKGLNIVALKMIQLSKENGERHYSVHKEKPFFKELVEYITSGPIIAIIVKGRNAISTVRNIVGATDGSKASPGTIRGDYSNSIERNLVHASDSIEAYEHESKIFFSEKEILNFSYGDENLL
ncbi:nucleoside-diphosphate kinase [Caldiplasma sukawensis]